MPRRDFCGPPVYAKFLACGTQSHDIWNMGLFKNTKLGERATLQLWVDVFNVFERRNFSLAQPSVFQSADLIGAVNNALSTTYCNLTSDLFLNNMQFTGGNR